nr:class I SAM-dependent methyltransferase [Gemmatimonadales bacterium]
MSDYKERFYRNYYTTHVLPRKGEATLARFRSRDRAYRGTWGRLLPEDRQSRILDVGCGSGSLVWWMQQRGYVNAAGIDVSAELVQVAGTLGVRNIEHADLRDYLGSRPAAYDLLILRDVLEHFDRAWILDVLELCRRSL